MSGIQAHPMRGALWRTWTEARTVERVAHLVGGVLLLSGLVHLCVLTISGGSWLGPLSLRKPTTFGLSFGLTLITVAWVTSFVRIGRRSRTVLLGTFTAVSVLETTLVSMQAWRGVPSHFNFQTPFDQTVSMTLAVGGGVIVATVVAFTVAALRGAQPMPATMLLAVRFGFLILLVSLGAGAAMIATGVADIRGGDAGAAYHSAGFLKPVHGVAMHAILVLPALAWLLGFTPLRRRWQSRIVWVAVFGYLALLGVVAATSIAGFSPLSAPPLAIASAALALAVLVSAGGVALYGLFRPTRTVPAGQACGSGGQVESTVPLR